MTFPVPDISRFKWPKQLPPMSPEQRDIADDFMAFWLSVLPKKFGLAEKFNHGYPLLSLARLPSDRNWKSVSASALTSRANRWIDKNTIVSSCAKRWRRRFVSCIFDRVIAVHVLEHLPNLPGPRPDRA
jgi:hypothetical protein